MNRGWGGICGSLEWAVGFFSLRAAHQITERSPFIAALFCHNPLTDCRGCSFVSAAELCAPREGGGGETTVKEEEEEEEEERKKEEEKHRLLPLGQWG